MNDKSIGNREAGRNVDSASCYVCVIQAEALCYCWGDDKGIRIVACRRLADTNLDDSRVYLCYSALTEAPWRATLVSRRCEVSGELGSLVTPGWRPQRHSLIPTSDTHRLIDLQDMLSALGSGDQGKLLCLQDGKVLDMST